MAMTSPPSGSGVPWPRAAWIIGVVAVLAASAGLSARLAPLVLASEAVFFADPDDYLRVYRARLVAERRVTCVRVLDEINHPHGALLHWTSPMDWLLAGAGRAFASLAPGTDRFAAVAAFVPPALGLIYLVLMMAMLRGVAGIGAALTGGLFTAISPAFGRAFELGHPDHHCLLELLFLAAVAPWMREPDRDGQASPPARLGAMASGLAAGLAMWAAPQGMLAWFFVVCGLFVGVGCAREERLERWRQRRLEWAAGAFAVTLAAHLVENWGNPLAADVDRVGIVQVVLAASGLMPDLSRRVRARVLKQRHEYGHEGWRGAAIGLVGLALLLLATWWLGGLRYVRSPEFFRWSALVAELQPLVTITRGDWSLAPLHANLGWMPWALPLLVLCLAGSTRATPPARLMLAAWAVAMTCLAVWQRRWLDHVNVGLVPVLVIGSIELAERIGRARHGRLPFVPAILAAALLAVLAWPTLARFSAPMPAGPDPLLLRTHAAAQAIRESHRHRGSEDGDGGAILSEDGEGPMLLYWTGLPVVATPYHRALDGLIAAARFFAERDPAAARAQLDHLNVRFIVVPHRPHEQLMNFEYMALGELRSYSPPDETIDEWGRVRRTLHYRPGYEQTMAYRLALLPDAHAIPGVESIARDPAGAPSPDGAHGFVYVVHAAGR